jgi:hypothetical protein
MNIFFDLKCKNAKLLLHISHQISLLNLTLWFLNKGKWQCVSFHLHFNHWIRCEYDTNPSKMKNSLFPSFVLDLRVGKKRTCSRIITLTLNSDVKSSINKMGIVILYGFLVCTVNEVDQAYTKVCIPSTLLSLCLVRG